MNEVTIIGKFKGIYANHIIVEENKNCHYVFARSKVLEKINIIPKDTSIKIKAHLDKNDIVANKIFMLLGDDEDEYKEV